jgi:plasmid stability protein
MADLSIKSVPPEEMEKLRARAKRNHRSLQGELRVILSQALSPEHEQLRHGKLSFEEALAELRNIPLRTPSESVRMIREDRDAR